MGEIKGCLLYSCVLALRVKLSSKFMHMRRCIESKYRITVKNILGRKIVMQRKYKSISMQRKALCSLVAVSLCWGAAPALASNYAETDKWEGGGVKENIDTNHHIKITGGVTDVNGTFRVIHDEEYQTKENGDAVDIAQNATLKIDGSGEVKIVAYNYLKDYAHADGLDVSGKLIVNKKNDDVGFVIDSLGGTGENNDEVAALKVNKDGSADIIADNLTFDNKGYTRGYGIWNNGKTKIIADTINFNSGSAATEGYGIRHDYGNLDIKADKIIMSIQGNGGAGIRAVDGEVTIQGNTYITVEGDKYSWRGIPVGIWNGHGSYNLQKPGADIKFSGNTTIKVTGKGSIGILSDRNESKTVLDAPDTNFISADTEAVKVTSGGSIKLSGKENYLTVSGDKSNTYSNLYGLHAEGTGSIIDVAAADKNTIISKKYGVYAKDSQVKMAAQGKGNIILSGEISSFVTDGMTGFFGDQTAIFVEKGGQYDLLAGFDEFAEKTSENSNNYISGTIRVEGINSSTKINSKANIKSTGDNYIYSSAHGKGYDQDVQNLSAVFAREKAEINIDGERNFIATYCENYGDKKTQTAETSESERVVWAQSQGKINIKGQTQIIASRAGENYCIEDHDHQGEWAANNMGIAVTAGSEQLEYRDGKWYDSKGEVDMSEGKSTVNIEYRGAHETIKDEDGRLLGLNGNHVNYISGDVVAGVNGLISIKAGSATKSSANNMFIKGNLLAGNEGQINVDLGNNGILYGRVDDYAEADESSLEEHIGFYNPVFSNKIYKGGTVTLKMGNTSQWTLDGQSWITNLAVGEGSVIDMSYQKNKENTYNQDAHALTIRNIGGYDSKFSEEGTAAASSDGITKAQNVKFIMDLNDKNHTDSDMLYIQNGKGEFKVEINEFEGNPLDIAANNTLRFATVGKESDIDFSEVRFNDGGIYDITFKVSSTETDKESPDTDNKDDDYNGSGLNPSKPGDSNVDNDNSYNFFLSGIESASVNNGGKIIIDMSRANYSNAVYMDRLNKRMGEMRYINDDEDQGLWVRMRHDRVGKDSAFKYKSTMYEIGYDEKQECDNGMRRVGAAIDYMHGDTTYDNVGGKGEIDRQGIWLYDTWMGDNGHYADYVAKWGHLANDYEIYNHKANKINGEYSNNVLSVSAEYGRKKDIGSNWYIEPQAQLQYARVTAADYVTTQGTEVSLDAINSLIARAGFRIGKDINTRSTIYFKGDILHEFLGEQEIHAKDGTGIMDKTFANKGTWYDLGFGFATALGRSCYAYADIEKSFGNDNDKTYQINVGMNWSF